MRVKFDATQIDDPRQASCVIDHNFLCRSVRRECERDGSQPRRSLGGRTLLIKCLSLSTMDEALEHNRTIPDPGDSARSYQQVVTYEIEFRDSCLR